MADRRTASRRNQCYLLLRESGLSRLDILAEPRPLCVSQRSLIATAPVNKLLSVLSSDSRSHLLSLATLVDLPIRTQLQNQNEQPNDVYLLVTGVASVVISLPDGSSTEVVIIGREAMTGCFSFLGKSTPPTECYMQVAGSGYRIPFAEMKAAFLNSEEVCSRILEIVQQQSLTMSQIAACNRLHDNEARLARWLLMVQDRLQDDVLPLTQEFLAVMLGSQRTTVAVSAGTLQRAGLIEYS